MRGVQREEYQKLGILAAVGCCLKILLIPSYFSTDFDVHHNWLRITAQKPLQEWYYDDLSKWTLDYPPLFAYFQYLLSQIASLINPAITEPTFTAECLFFQRLSVIVTETPFLLVIFIIFDKKVSLEMVLSYLFVPFILLDNIHFQYNMMLQTVFLLSAYFMVRKNNYLMAALTYSALLNFKHIYLYCSLAYFTIILRFYVFRKGNSFNQRVTNFIKVGVITLAPFIVSFLPLLLVGGPGIMEQIGSRLFPFGRGLIHDYWAPNFWAIYYALDKGIFFALHRLFRWQVSPLAPVQHGGLDSLRLLPQPSAQATLMIVLMISVPVCWRVFKKPRFDKLGLILVCGLIFFVFGYHVHEKAITPYLHLLFVFYHSAQNAESSQKQKSSSDCDLAAQDEEKDCLLLGSHSQIDSTNKEKRQKMELPLQQGHSSEKYVYGMVFVNMVNLFPLLIRVEETPLKVALTLISIGIWVSNNNLFGAGKDCSLETRINKVILFAGIFVVVYGQFLSRLPLLRRYEFLPLMINSVVCGLINVAWASKSCYDVAI